VRSVFMRNLNTFVLAGRERSGAAWSSPRDMIMAAGDGFVCVRADR
jgi:hypothetical protein